MHPQAPLKRTPGKVCVALFLLLLSMALVVGCRTPAPVQPPTDIALPTHTPTLSPTHTPVPSQAPTPTSMPAVTSRADTPAPLPATSTFTPTPIPSTSTPQSTATPTSMPTPSPSPPPSVSVWEGTIALSSYGWEEALLETAPDDPVYPYPRLDQGRVGPPALRTYATVVLENEYARLTFLPELGGRLLRWLDIPSGREMFYANPVVKPTHWGARGWWLATGGMEWAFPVEEHGLVEWRPWAYRIDRGVDRAGIVLTTEDDRTGLGVEVTVLLEAGRSYFTVRPRVFNPTEREQAFQFWLNGMVALSPDNRPSPELRFSLPGDGVVVHSTGDPELPGEGQAMHWPVHDGRDMSRYGNWAGWLGIFAYQAPYMAAYDLSSGMGVVRVSPMTVATGTKVFGPGTLDPGIWTDDGSGYVELWSGLTPTFWEDASLPPGGEVSWQERWYSLNGLGGLCAANDDAALWLEPGPGPVQVGALSTAPLAGRLELWHGEELVATWQRTLAPDAPLRATYPAGGSGSWRLVLSGEDGQPIVDCQATGP